MRFRFTIEVDADFNYGTDPDIIEEFGEDLPTAVKEALVFSVSRAYDAGFDHRLDWCSFIDPEWHTAKVEQA